MDQMMEQTEQKQMTSEELIAALIKLRRRQDEEESWTMIGDYHQEADMLLLNYIGDEAVSRAFLALHRTY